MSMDYESFEQLLKENKHHLQQYLAENLLPNYEAMELTGQSINAFNQSVKLGYVLPFYWCEKNGRKQYMLFMREDLIYYKKRKRPASTKQQDNS